MIDQAIYDLIAYAVRTGLIEAEDETWCANALLERLKLDSYAPPAKANERPVHEILQELTDDAVARGVLEDDQTLRDLFDTGLMGCLTPRASEVRRTFREKYAEDPGTASGATCAGRPKQNTAIWTSRSTSPSPKRRPRPLPP